MSTKDQVLKNSIIKEELLKLSPYIFYFFIFAFIGWVGETIFCYVTEDVLMKRGFLYAPICPIYGYGALILMVYLDKSKSQHKYIKLFFMFILIFSIFEYLTGFVLEALFSARWWDYSDSKYNLNGRITVLNSLIWGFATILYAKLVYPLTTLIKEKYISKIPELPKLIITCLLLTAHVTDIAFSCVRYLK